MKNLTNHYKELIVRVKKKLFGKIKHDGIIYVKCDYPELGGLALALKSNWWSTEGEYYRIVMCYDSFIGFIGDDNYPCGLFSEFSGNEFIYYRKLK